MIGKVHLNTLKGKLPTIGNCFRYAAQIIRYHQFQRPAALVLPIMMEVIGSSRTMGLHKITILGRHPSTLHCQPRLTSVANTPTVSKSTHAQFHLNAESERAGIYLDISSEEHTSWYPND